MLTLTPYFLRGFELWHGTWEGDQSDICHIDPESGKVLARLTMPEGMGVSGLESDVESLHELRIRRNHGLSRPRHA